MLNQELFGTLTNGTPITGTIDDRDPTGRSGIVHADLGAWQLTAQDAPNLVTIDGDDSDILIESVTIDQLNALRALLATDFPEQLLTVALAYGQGAAAPPAWEGAPIAPSALTVALAYQEGFEEGADAAVADLHAAWKKRQEERREAVRCTLAEVAQEPDMRAAFAQLSPVAQRAACDLTALLDRMPLDEAERTLDRVLDALALPPSKPIVDAEPIVTMVDTGERSGIRVERVEWPDGHAVWLDFNVGPNIPGFTSGRVSASIDLYGGQPGIELIVHGNEIARDWTLAQIRQLRDDIDLLLRDDRLLGALAEHRAAA